MAIKIGTIEVTDVAVGATGIGTVTIGSNVVWQKVLPAPLCFTGTVTDSVRLTKVGNPDEANIEYSKDGSTWTAYTFGTWIDFDGTNNKVYFRAASDNNTAFYTDTSNYYRFELEENSPTTVSGNLDTLLNKNGTRHITKSRTYRELFYGMAGLTDASQLELPSDTMTLQCYYGTFQGCNSLSSAPALLPAMTLASSCYRLMFYDCWELRSTPELPATNLVEHCYRGMFQDNFALTDAPELPATTLSDYCYSSMFNGCSNLSSITVGFSDWQPANATNAWVDGVAASGKFYCPDELSVVRGVSNIPTNWEVNPAGPWLCFTAEQANSTVAMAAKGSAPEVSLECSTDGRTWSPFVVGTTTVTLANIGDKVYVRATSVGNTGMGTSTSKYNKFVMTGKIGASGNVDTLLDQNGNATLTNYCYYNMFNGCTALTSAPELPATTLASNCYRSMFSNCTSLTQAPVLPATTLVLYCYTNMFYGCSSLSSITVGFSDWQASLSPTQNWVYIVASSGTFTCPSGLSDIRDASHIPTGWTKTNS